MNANFPSSPVVLAPQHRVSRQRPTTNDQIKEPRAGFPDTGLVSLTMTCLRYLVMNPELLSIPDLSEPTWPQALPVTCHLSPKT